MQEVVAHSVVSIIGTSFSSCTHKQPQTDMYTE